MKTTTTGQQLAVGDYFPVKSLKNVFNYSSDTLSFTDFKGKAIILDFWGFNCTACLRSFPKLDSLQNKFNDKLQIIMVNQEGKNETNAFFVKRKKIKLPFLPFITNDSILNSSFSHTGVPYLAWISTAGKISYLTDGEYLTGNNIEMFLEGIDLNLPKSVTNSYQTSLFRTDVERSVRYFSYIATCIDQGSYHITGFEKSSATVNTYYCASVKDLYQFAYNESLNEGNYKFREPGRTILEVVDKSKYEYPSDPLLNSDWIKDHSYYYHLSVPEEKRKEKFKIMQQDLNRYFSLDANVVKKRVRCLELIRTSKKDKLKSTGGTSYNGTFTEDLRVEDTSFGVTVKNKPFKFFFILLKDEFATKFNIIVVDKTGYKENIDFKWSSDAIQNINLQSFRKVLRQYDLDLLEKGIEMEILLLKERKEMIK